MYKFRTMVANAEKLQLDLEKLNEAGWSGLQDQRRSSHHSRGQVSPQSQYRRATSVAEYFEGRHESGWASTSSDPVTFRGLTRPGRAVDSVSVRELPAYGRSMAEVPPRLGDGSNWIRKEIETRAWLDYRRFWYYRDRGTPQRRSENRLRIRLNGTPMAGFCHGQDAGSTVWMLTPKSTWLDPF